MAGQPSQGVRFDALIDDQGLSQSREGASATLEELDHVRIDVQTNHLSASLGDANLYWHSGRYGIVERRIRGGVLMVDGGWGNSRVAISGNGARAATSWLVVRPGDQGPYDLTDRFGRNRVPVVYGSETVRLDGRKLSRGHNNDYDFDYEAGQITFNPLVPLGPFSRVEVSYQTAEEDYSETFLALQSETDGLGIHFTATAAQEANDPEQPLSFEWNSGLRSAARAAGARSPTVQASGIEEVGNGKGDYIRGVTPDSTTILVFSPPDSLAHPTGNLRVTFSRVAGGDYEQVYDDSLLTIYYRYTGRGAGKYMPIRSIPLPDRLRTAQVQMAGSVGGIKMSVEAAQSQYSPNLMAPIRGAGSGAVDGVVGWRRPDSILSTELSFRREEVGFRTLSSRTPGDYQLRWGLDDNLERLGETELGVKGSAKLMNKVLLSVEGGQLSRGKGISAQRASAAEQIQSASWSLSNEVNLYNLQTDSTDEETIGEKWTGVASIGSGRVIPALTWGASRRRTYQQHLLCRGEVVIQAAPNLKLIPMDGLTLNPGSIFRRTEAVTGGRFVWNSTFRAGSLVGTFDRPSVSAKLTGSRSSESFSQQGQKPLRSTSIVASVINGRGTPLQTSLDYHLTTGNGHPNVELANYVGEGRGDYRWDGERYVPDPSGDFDRSTESADTSRYITNVDLLAKASWRVPLQMVAGVPLQPLGITRAILQFDGAVSTFASDPVRAFYLDRATLQRPEAARSRWNWKGELFFLEGDPAGDGKLTLRRNELSNRAVGGGESELLHSVGLMVRMQTRQNAEVTLEPFWMRDTRMRLTDGTAKSSVTSVGGDATLRFDLTLGNSVVSLKAGYDQRIERVRDLTITERRLLPTWMVRFGSEGSLQLNGEWRNLKGSSIAGYDLTRSWYLGNNFAAGAALQYILAKNLSAYAIYRSIWRGGRAPIISGSAQVTATL